MAHIERNMIQSVRGYWSQQEVVDEIEESYAASRERPHFVLKLQARD